MATGQLWPPAFGLWTGFLATSLPAGQQLFLACEAGQADLSLAQPVSPAWAANATAATARSAMSFFIRSIR